MCTMDTEYIDTFLCTSCNLWNVYINNIYPYKYSLLKVNNLLLNHTFHAIDISNKFNYFENSIFTRQKKRFSRGPLGNLKVRQRSGFLLGFNFGEVKY